MSGSFLYLAQNWEEDNIGGKNNTSSYSSYLKEGKEVPENLAKFAF